MDVIEVVLGEYVLRLDHTVVEVLHRTRVSYRFHVNHVAVDAKRGRTALRVHIGIEESGIVVMGARSRCRRHGSLR